MNTFCMLKRTHKKMSLLVAAVMDGQQLHQNKSTSVQFPYTKKNLCI